MSSIWVANNRWKGSNAIDRVFISGQPPSSFESVEESTVEEIIMSSFLPNADLTARAIRDAYSRGDIHVSRSQTYPIWRQHRRHLVRARAAAALRRVAAALEPVEQPVRQCGALG
jgi:hypothetical protein